jgi:hypothetical protein
MWGGIKRSHVVAAVAATVGVMVGAAGAAAYDAADDDARTIYRQPDAVNIDRIAYFSTLEDGGATLTGRSGAESISAAGRGFVDVEDVPAEHDAAIEGAGIEDDRGGRGQVFSD